MRTPPKVVLSGWIAGIAQFGLAILAWGGWRPFFSHPAFVALAWLTVALLLVVPFSQGNTSPGIREDRGNRWVLVAFSLFAVVDAYLPAFTDRIGFWTIDGSAIRWIGVALCAGGGALRIAPVFVLGRRFSGLVAIQPGHTLETRGLYGTIRNPSYLGLMVSVLGWALVFRSIVGLLMAALLMAPLVARMRAEERLLREYFGAEYDAYFARTWRLVPGIY